MRRGTERGRLPAVGPGADGRAPSGMISPDGAALPAAALDAIQYPDIAVPHMGQVLPVQQGVWWLRMPLPISLDHINLWLLEETGGYALVDTGMATAAAREVWEH